MTQAPIIIRLAEASDIPDMARIWFHGWQDGHLHLLPEEIRAMRTLERFTERLEEGLADVLVATLDGRVTGLCMLKGDELYQFYVDAPARGTGLAADLMQASEQELVRRGQSRVYLICAVGNVRAARFYEKCGWDNMAELDLAVGDEGKEVLVRVWRYEKEIC